MTLRTVIALMTLAGALAPFAAAAQTGPGGPGYWHGWDWGWGHMIFGSLMMVLFWAGIIVVIVLVVRWASGRSEGPGRAESRSRALDILRERFARGEIDKEEFEERKRALSE